MLRGRAIRILLAVMAFPLAWTPSVSAQDNRVVLDVTHGELPELLIPGSAGVRIPITVRIVCPATQPTPETWEIYLKAVGLPFTTLALEPADHSVSVGGSSAAQCSLPDQALEVHSNLTIAATTFAPGLQPFPVRIMATMIDNVPPEHVGEANTTFELIPAFYSSLVLNPATTLMRVEPGDVFVFPVELENRGNGETRVRISAPNTTDQDGLHLSLQDEILLDSQIAGGKRFRQTININGRPDGDDALTSRQVTFRVNFRAESTSPLFRGPGVDSGLNFTVLVQGVGNELPSPSIPVVLLGGLVALALARRRRERLQR